MSPLPEERMGELSCTSALVMHPDILPNLAALHLAAIIQLDKKLTREGYGILDSFVPIWQRTLDLRLFPSAIFLIPFLRLS